jgi:hypothetical protein
METNEVSPHLPEGWKVERLFTYHQSFVIEAPNKQGFMSIDFNRRAFNTGYGQPHGHCGEKNSYDAYKGAGWKKRLITDAVQHLTKILES